MVNLRNSPGASGVKADGAAETIEAAWPISLVEIEMDRTASDLETPRRCANTPLPGPW